MARPVSNVDFYKRLDVSRGASEEEIKKAFRSLAKKVHPDLHPGDPTSEAAFKALNEAYSVLSNASERRNYDLVNPTAGLRRREERSSSHPWSPPPFRETGVPSGAASEWGDFLREEAERSKAAERLRAAASRGHEGGGASSHFDGWEARRAARLAAAEAAAASKGLSETGHYRAQASQWRAANKQGGFVLPILGFLVLSSVTYTLASNGALMTLRRR